MTVRLTDAEIDDLVARFDVMSMGEWDRGAVERVTADLGWTLRSEVRHGLTFVGPLPGGWNYAHRGHVLGSPGEGCFTSLECDLARTDDDGVLGAVFKAANGAAEARMGPAPIRRGPGPVLRWRREETLLEIEWTRDRVRLRLLATKVVEHHEYQLAEWGERDDSVAELGVWQGYLYRHAALRKAFTPGVRQAETWDEFGRWLGETLKALVTDMGRLDDSLDMVIRTSDDDDSRFVQFSCSAEELHLEAADGARKALLESGTGWQFGTGPVRLPEIRVPNPGPGDAEPAARALVHALRAQDVRLEDLVHMVWLRGESDHAPNMHGLGLPEI
ncbi:hypothetical protein ACIBSV_09785 [Embleya sp. NPDC050154]|uniref:hypothetical protein n=1 Tax=unclassified Embleya TaxID=2699296 RepID=UPI003790CB50